MLIRYIILLVERSVTESVNAKQYWKKVNQNSLHKNSFEKSVSKIRRKKKFGWGQKNKI